MEFFLNQIENIDFETLSNEYSKTKSIIAYEKVVLSKKQYYILSYDFWCFIKNCGYTIPVILKKNSFGKYIPATDETIRFIFLRTKIINNNYIKLNLDKKKINLYLMNKN